MLKPLYFALACLAAAMALGAAPQRSLASNAVAKASNPQAFALRLPIQTAPGAGLQRVDVPAQALIRLQSPAYADLRVFNGEGQPLPMAWVPQKPTEAERRSVTVPALPIMGPSASLGKADLTLRVDASPSGQVVRVETRSPGVSDASATRPSAEPALLGVLFDARDITSPTTALELQAEVPDAQPTRLSLHASTDLKTWQPVAETVIYRLASANLLAGHRIELKPTDLKGQYLKVTWPQAAQAGAAVSVKGAVITHAQQFHKPQRLRASVSAKLNSPHEVAFGLPFSTPIAGLQIAAEGNNLLVPVRLLGRNGRDQPWVPLGATVIYKLQQAGNVQSNGAMELGAVAFKEMKLEADPKTPGFTQVPNIELEFDAPQLVFVATGSGPFTLAAGQKDLQPQLLPLSSLIPGYKAGAEADWPLARVDLAGLPAATVSGGSSSASNSLIPWPPAREWVLWGVLLGGVLALGAMAWALMRQNKSAPKPPSE